LIILGIDPGLERIGCGIIRVEGSRITPVHYCLIQTPKVVLTDRLRLIHDQMAELLDTYKPDAIATERQLFAQNKTTAMDVAKALGVILLTTQQYGIAWAEYSPPEIKQAVVGNGAADKKQVQFMVTKLLGLQSAPKPDDVADGLAIAITHAMRYRMARIAGG
jgi:crossover junction endodeoxyribonuclease RuvC